MSEKKKSIYNVIIDSKFWVPIILCIAFIIVIGSGLFVPNIKKYMKTNLFKIGKISMDFWSIAHILLYIYFGYNFPDYFVEFMFIGVLWEIFEVAFCKENFNKIISCNDADGFICRIMNKINGCDYWYGKIDDIIMNMSGFLIGRWLRNRQKIEN